MDVHAWRYMGDSTPVTGQARGLQVVIAVSERATGLITIINDTPVDLLLARHRCPIRLCLGQREQREMLGRWGAALTASLVAARAAVQVVAGGAAPSVWVRTGNGCWAQMWGLTLRDEGALFVLPAGTVAREFAPNTALLVPLPHRAGYASCDSLSVMFSDVRGDFNDLHLCDGTRDDDYALVWDYETQPRCLRVQPLFAAVQEWVQTIATTDEWSRRFEWAGPVDDYLAAQSGTVEAGRPSDAMP